MSLQFIIDGYNLTNHPLFRRLTLGKNISPRIALAELIKLNNLCGSFRNKVTVVFDGYPAFRSKEATAGVLVVFSRDISADERIRHMLQHHPSPKNAVVVSNDKEIRLFCKAYRARCMSIEEFLTKAREKQWLSHEDPGCCELSYTQMQRINDELKRVWL